MSKCQTPCLQTPSVALNFPGNLPLYFGFPLSLPLPSQRQSVFWVFLASQPLVFGVQKGGWGWAGRTGSPPGLGVRAWGTGDSHSLRCWGQEGGGPFIQQQAGKNSFNPLCLAFKQNQGLKYVCEVYYILDREFLFRAKVPGTEIWGVKWSSGSANQLAKRPDNSLSKARLPRLTPEAFPALTF